VISATPAPGAKPSAAPGPAPGRRLAAPGAAQAAGHSRPVTRGTHHRATPVCTVPARPRLLLLSHASAACLCRITAIAAAPPPHPPYITPSPQTSPFSHIIPYPPPPTRPRPPLGSGPPRHPLRATRPREPECQPNERRTRTQTERNLLIHGKPFLTAGNAPADYAESPTTRPGPERIEGVSRSLPNSDLLTLTSSHVFFCVMN
jgi:hypothetical protein